MQNLPKVAVEKVNTLSGHWNSVYCLEQGPDAESFFSAGGDGMVARWLLSEPENGQLMAKVPASVYALCHIPEQNLLVIGHNYQGIRLIDLGENKETGSLQLTDAAIFALAYRQGKLWVGTGDGLLIVVDMATRSVQKHIKASEKSLRALQFSADGLVLAAAYSDHTIKLFNPDTYEPLQVIRGHQNSVFSIQYSPDGRYLLSVGRDAHLRIWKTGKVYEPFKDIVAHMYAINHVEYSPCGQYFATASLDKSIKVWEAETFRLIKVIDKGRHAGHATSVNRLLWLKHDTLLAASDDRTISVWKLNISKKS
jgi:WD40 repeat protein